MDWTVIAVILPTDLVKLEVYFSLYQYNGRRRFLKFWSGINLIGGNWSTEWG